MTEPADLALSPVSTGQIDVEVVAQLLDQILSKAHPLLAEGLYLAAVPHLYNTAFFKAMRAREDGRDEKLVARLARFSFITSLDESTEEDGRPGPQYAMLATERQILLRRWIATDPDAFVTAHQRALAFVQAHPHPDPFTQDQICLYHLLVTDGKAGLEHLGSSFRAYAKERRLAAADQLLAAVAEVRTYLAALGVSWLADFDDLLAYLRARLVQYRGEWAKSLDSLEALRQKQDLASSLLPFVARAYGSALARMGLYVEAVEQYQFALDIFGQQPNNDTEQAFTMFDLGDAYVGLAVSARGYRQLVSPPTGHWWRQWLNGLISFRALLPLIAYLSLHFGLRVWHPKLWPMLQGQDWIIARLFVMGAHWYRRARRLLSAVDTPADRLLADGKLAHLYLTMGDASQAVSSFQQFLEERDVPLGEYRRASVQAGLGQALLRLGQSHLALEYLQGALPVVQAYDDPELEARVQGLLAEALFASDEHAKALRQFRQALHLYQRQGDVVGATEIAERLGELAHDWRLDDKDRKIASTTTQSLTRRQYQGRFQHPALVAFRRMSLVLMTVLIFFIPMLTIHVETESIIEADLHFYPSALIAPDPDFSPTLSQTVALNVEPSFEAEFAFQQAMVLLVLYLLAYAALGVVLIFRTRLRAVQVAQEDMLRLDLQGLTMGKGEKERTVRWKEISRISIADIELFGGSMADNSFTVVTSPQGELEIKGSIAWYTALQGHIRTFASGARVVQLGYRVLQSRMGLLYGLSVLSLTLFLAIKVWMPDVLLTDFLGPYSLADLYPYLYVGLLLPSFWWLVVRPLQIQMRLNPRSSLAWWVGGVGLVLAVLRLVFSGLWLIPPDIYPLLSIIFLLGSAGTAIWRTCLHQEGKQEPGPHVYPLWVRGLVAAVVTAILVLASVFLWREVEAYHLLITGNSQRDEGLRAQRQSEDAIAVWLQEKALDSYTRVLGISPQNITALSSRAAVHAQLGRFEDAIADYTDVLRHPQVSDVDFAYRAMAYEGWGLALWSAGDADAAQVKLEAALSDFDQAIDHYPQADEYFVRRGAIQHVLKQAAAAQLDYEQALALYPENERALIGKGWILFQRAVDLSDAANQEKDEAKQEKLEAQAQDTFRFALADFEKAAEYASDLPEVWLAVGYGHFRLGEYQAAIEAWEQAVELAPDDPVMVISRGMGHWILADADRCTSDTATRDEKEQAIARLNLAIDDLNRALELRPDDDWTYRTRSQIEYLLAYCPGYDTKQMLYKAIGSYDEALKHNPENDLYWQFRARLGFVLGRHIFVREPGNEDEAWLILSFAKADITRAHALNPENDATLVWRDYITQEAWGHYHRIRGWNYYDAGDFRFAEVDAEMAAFLLPQNAETAFNAGLIALAQGKANQATAWYNEGLDRVMAPGQADARLRTLQIALEDLTARLEASPGLRWLGEPILEELRAAHDAAASE